MRYPFAYAACLVAAAIILAGFYVGGVFNFALPVGAYVHMPIADHWQGRSHWPSERALARMTPRTKRRFEHILPLAAITSVVLLGWALWAVSVTPLAWWEFAGLALSMGMMSGLVGVVVSHELLHRGNRAAFPLMALIGYSHYCVEHIRGHHVLVATPEDAATARRGESLYAFLPRTISWGLRTAWRIERLRLSRSGRGAFSPRNRILIWHGFTLAVMAAIGLLLGPVSLLLFVAQGVIAFSILGAIDYIEHYGLLRERLADGRHERVGSAHAWNCNFVLSNVSMLNLGRHTAHHVRPALAYYRLRADADAPQLPYGYPVMVLIALIPPLWFRVMDRELAAYHAGRAQAPA